MDNMDYSNFCNVDFASTRGYSQFAVITNTLQGRIYRAWSTQLNCKVVIKVTSKTLHYQSLGRVITEDTTTDQYVKCNEDIIRESNFLKYISADPRLSTYSTKYIDFFEDRSSFFLVMEHGGTSLFEFVKRAHTAISASRMTIAEWHNIVRSIWKQMVTFIYYLHCHALSCHMDISLENILISLSSNDKRVHIKFCDFGLAEYYKNDFTESSLVGKSKYQSPEMYSRQISSFDARMCDIWSAGVCLFAMVFGVLPFDKPCPLSDDRFKWIVMGGSTCFNQLIRVWKKSHLIDDHMFGVLCKIFKLQPKQRVTIKQLFEYQKIQM